ncbi:MAG TPA: alpha/beta fold hydrolase [Aeromicrobium sp.]|nr:alpha/beta fold hydrolase [Aeromicrobium sp.]
MTYPLPPGGPVMGADVVDLDCLPPVQHVTVHGYRRAYVKVGSGPALLLLHGLGCDHRTWDPIIGKLAEHYTVIAPDFLGHGASDKPRADYSLGGYANGMRDLLTILGIDKVTVVGHSFGGGVAMQFAYQFPERTERLVLVSSGGLGPEVSLAIKAITLPGFHQFVGLVNLPGVRTVVQSMLVGLSDSGVPALRDLDEVAEILESWRDPNTRRAIRHLVHACIDMRGQIVTMRDRAYLTAAMPMALVWGTHDQVLPVEHAAICAALAPEAAIEIFEDSGHFPHKDDPERFVAFLMDFIRETQPAVYRRSNVRRLLLTGGTTAVEAKKRELVVIPGAAG